jgi:hypothetical protein
MWYSCTGSFRGVRTRATAFTSRGWRVFRPVNERAKDVLAQLESDHRDALDRPTIQTPGAAKSEASGKYQMTLFGFADHPLIERVQKLDVNAMTPIEAMQFLQEAQASLEKIPTLKR